MHWQELLISNINLPPSLQLCQIEQSALEIQPDKLRKPETKIQVRRKQSQAISIANYGHAWTLASSV